MTDEITTPTTDAVEPAAAPAAPAAPVTPAQPAEAAQDPATLPQWARDSITRANSEAAEYRTKLNAAKAERDTATAELTTKLTTRERELAMALTGLPKEVAGSVVGSTYEELLASAQALAPLFVNQNARTPQVPASLNGGLTPDAPGGSTTFDPAALAEEAMRHSRLAR